LFCFLYIEVGFHPMTYFARCSFTRCLAKREPN
jgi:hypothetical protein